LNKEDLYICCGLDFGFSLDPTAFVASILDEKDKKIYVYREIVVKGKTNIELADLLTTEGFSKAIIIADSAEPKSIEELRQEGIRRIRPSKKGPDSIIHGIQKLQQYEIIVDPSCIHVITELENYSWQKDKSGEYIQRPIDDFNHCLDALRYSLQCVNAQGRVESFDKHLLGL
jgi:phage terminase large subunit